MGPDHVRFPQQAAHASVSAAAAAAAARSFQPWPRRGSCLSLHHVRWPPEGAAQRLLRGAQRVPGPALPGEAGRATRGASLGPECWETACTCLTGSSCFVGGPSSVWRSPKPLYLLGNWRPVFPSSQCRCWYQHQAGRCGQRGGCFGGLVLLGKVAVTKRRCPCGGRAGRAGRFCVYNQPDPAVWHGSPLGCETVLQSWQ